MTSSQPAVTPPSVTLPIVTLDNGEKWDCHQCGFCCRGSVVPLSVQDAELLRSQNWEEQPEYRNTRIMVRYPGAASSYRLAHRADGSCVFLNEDGLCRIHSKFGLEAKPTICQTFPLQLIPHEKKAVLTFRRACPSSAADMGSPSKSYLPFVEKMVRDQRLKAQAVAAPMLKPGELRDWKTIRSVLQAAGNLLQDQRYPPVRRLVHALQFANLLSKAKTRRLSDAQIGELAQTLMQVAPDESKPFFEEPQEPKGYAKVMFRLMAIDCARIHPECRHQSKWSARFQLMRTAWKTLRGTGPTPFIDKTFPTAPFEKLEEPLGIMEPEIYLPLTRLIETTSASYLYAIADRGGWSVVESIRGLAILYPVGLWLLRWLAHDREPTYEDMLHIVVALDRSQGYAPLSGTIHRWRLTTLSVHEELERLVVWYAR